MPSLSPDPGFDNYYKACRKDDSAAKAVPVGDSAVRVLADASEITELLRDNFEVREITREELRRLPIRLMTREDAAAYWAMVPNGWALTPRCATLAK